MQAGQLPVSVGFWFALGHSAVVLATAVALAAASLFTASEGYRELDGLIGTGVSTAFLILIGLVMQRVDRQRALTDHTLVERTPRRALASRHCPLPRSAFSGALPPLRSLQRLYDRAFGV